MASGRLMQTTAQWFREYTLFKSRWKEQITHYHCALLRSSLTTSNESDPLSVNAPSNSGRQSAALTVDFCSLFLVLYVVRKIAVWGSSAMQHVSSWYRIKYDELNEKIRYSEDCSCVMLEKSKTSVKPRSNPTVCDFVVGSLKQHP
jgi:hypothetical protein